MTIKLKKLIITLFVSTLFVLGLVGCQQKSKVSFAPVISPARQPEVGYCDCPYDTDARGYSCGGRSAYDRTGGREPVCYVQSLVPVNAVDQPRSSGFNLSWLFWGCVLLYGAVQLCTGGFEDNQKK